MGIFLPTFHPIYSFLFWAGARDFSKLGNIRIGDINGEKLVTAHSKGEEARKLDIWRVPRNLLLKANFSGSLDMGERILLDFTLAGGRLQSNISKSSTHPVFKEKISKFRKVYITKIFTKSNKKSGSRIRIANQELSSPASSSWWPLGKNLWLSWEPWWEHSVVPARTSS